MVVFYSFLYAPLPLFLPPPPLKNVWIRESSTKASWDRLVFIFFYAHAQEWLSIPIHYSNIWEFQWLEKYHAVNNYINKCFIQHRHVSLIICKIKSGFTHTRKKQPISHWSKGNNFQKSINSVCKNILLFRRSWSVLYHFGKKLKSSYVWK